MSEKPRDLPRKKLVLLEANSPIWAKVAGQLFGRGIQLIYWSGAPSEVCRTVPFLEGCSFQSSLDAKIGRPIIAPSTKFGVDEVCTRAWERGLPTALGQFERFDLLSGDFGFEAKSSLFMQYLVIWRDYLRIEKPDLIVFPVMPHVCYDYALFCLAKELGVATLVFDTVSVFAPFFRYSMAENNQARSVGSGDISDLSNWSYARSSQAPVVHESDFEILEKFRNPREKPLSEMRTPRKVVAKYLKVAVYLSKVIMLSFSKKENSYLPRPFKLRGFDFEDSTVRWTPMREARSLVLSIVRTGQNRRAYEKLALRAIPSGKRLAYFALSYQPERTSNPACIFGGNQQLILEELDRQIPKGWHLLVKEHPSQFMPERQVDLVRRASWYRSISKLKNVSLVSLNVSGKDLISQCELTMTLTGTSAIEAATRGKTGVIFGSCWFEKMPGIRRISNLKEVRDLFEQQEGGVDRGVDGVLEFISLARDGSLPVLTDAPYFDYEWEQDDSGALVEAISGFISSHAMGLHRKWPDE